MAQKQAKMGHRGGKQVHAGGEKIKNRVTGNVLTGFVVVNENGEPVSRVIENMWDAIHFRRRLDSGV